MLDRLTCVEVFTAVIAVVTGLSHILHPRLWTRLFLDLFERPYAGLIVGMFTMPLGVMIAVTHNLWAWDVRVIVTILGWGWSIKGGLYLIRPHTVQQVGARHMQHPWRFQVAGAFILLVAVVILVDVALRLR